MFFRLLGRHFYFWLSYFVIYVYFMYCTEISHIKIYIYFYIQSAITFQLEKLQAENAAEWDKRERLETKKISLERENKQLRLKVYDLQERMEARRSRPVSITDADTKQLQQELIVRNMVRSIIPSIRKYF